MKVKFLAKGNTQTFDGVQTPSDWWST